MTEDIKDLLELADKVTENNEIDEQEPKTAKRSKKRKDEAESSWGVKKRDDIIDLLMKDMSIHLNHIASIASSPVVMKDLEAVFKDMALLKKLL